LFRDELKNDDQKRVGTLKCMTVVFGHEIIIRTNVDGERIVREISAQFPRNMINLYGYFAGRVAKTNDNI